MDSKGENLFSILIGRSSQRIRFRGPFFPLTVYEREEIPERVLQRPVFCAISLRGPLLTMGIFWAKIFRRRWLIEKTN